MLRKDTVGMKLQSKVALITGGTTGIGFATAELFQREGAQVVITGTNPANLKAAQEKLGPKAVVIEANAAKIADSERVAKEIEHRFGGVDVVFLNAGIAQFAPHEAVTEEFYDKHFDINVKGPYFQLQKLLPLLRAGASVILTSSIVNQKGLPGASVYAATKAAVRSLVRSFGVELVGRGIRVNTISPGPVATPIYGKLGMDSDAVKAFEEQSAAINPMKRFGTSEEIAAAALFLASSDSSYVTGMDLLVDGGFTQF
ncbi:MAG: SDR family oxidoreductase [Bryobacteraceae bacterium]|nr:SDR family oxidoreductase [Bryobacteraceae bacterium]